MVATRKGRCAPQKMEEEMVTAQHSLQVVRCLLQVSVQNIMYLRKLLPEDAFVEKNMPVVEGKAMLLDKAKDNEQGAMVVDWVDKGVMHAIKRSYAKRAIFGMSADPDGRQLLEEYVFSFDYGGDGTVTMRMAGGKSATSGKGRVSKAPSAAMVADQLKRMLRLLVVTCGTLDEPPAERYIFMKVTYHDHTPDDYEPPLFEPAGDRAVGCFCRKPFSLKVGTVDMKHHAVTMAVKTVLDSVEVPFSADAPVADQTRATTAAPDDSMGEVSGGVASSGGRTRSSGSGARMEELFTEYDAGAAAALGGEARSPDAARLQAVKGWALRRPQLDFMDAMQHFSDLSTPELEAVFRRLVQAGVLVEGSARDVYTVPAYSPLSPAQPGSARAVERAAERLGHLAVAAGKAQLASSQAGGMWANGGSTCTQSVLRASPASKRKGRSNADGDENVATGGGVQYWPSSQGSDRAATKRKASMVENVIHQGKRARGPSRLGGMKGR